MRKKRGTVVLFLVALLLVACGNPPEPPALPIAPTVEARGFRMGFTPWPYAASVAAVADVYAKITAHGDMISHHIDGGIPWEEAFTGVPWPEHVRNEIQGRLDATPEGTPVFLSLNPLNTERDGLAGNWGDSENEPLPEAWAGRTFDDPNVIEAYTRFALDLIERFQPMWFCYAIEVSELMVNDPEGFEHFKAFATPVYGAIKAAHPDLPVLVSVALKHPDSEEMAIIRRELPALLPYTDLLGLSVYPYIFYGQNGDPAGLPENWLSQGRELAGDRQLCITETAWLAQNLRIWRYGVSIEGCDAWQNQYVARLNEAAQALDAAFVVWWCVADFDDLWRGALARNPLAAIWRDTGLYDEGPTPRAGLATWDGWLALPRVP